MVSSDSSPVLYDRAAVCAHRARANASGSDCWFLHDYALSQIQERLKEVNKTFTKAAIVGGRSQVWADGLHKGLGIRAECFEDTDTLALPRGQFDLIIHGLALHWANDPIGQLVQMRLALAPDGLMIAVFFGGQSLRELRVAFTEAESQIRGGISPRIMPMIDIKDGGALLQRAGLGEPVADTLTLNLSYESPLALMGELRAMGEANAQNGRAKGFMPRKLLDRVCEIYTERFSLDDKSSDDSSGRVSATAELVFLTGWSALAIPAQTD